MTVSPNTADMVRIDGRPDLSALLERVQSLNDPAGGTHVSVLDRVVSGAHRWDLPRVHISGPEAGHDQIRLGLFAGLHGDEPAGCVALVQFAQVVSASLARIAGYELMIYPVINPFGYEKDTRQNHQGLDLNREFWRGSMAVEVQALEQELRSQKFDGIVTLHSDDTCEGIYGYAHGRTLEESLLKPALKTAARYLPLDRRAKIDGFAAQEGLIQECFQHVLSAPSDQRPRPFDLIFETPARAPFDLQVSAGVAALEEIISIYPGFIAYAQDL